MNKTISVLIGNSDNKLSQKSWVKFIHEVGMAIYQINYRDDNKYFEGYSSPTSEHQNACWVFRLENEPFETIEKQLDDFYQVLINIKNEYGQDNIAVVIGESKLI
jgi:hypothetical protein